MLKIASLKGIFISLFLFISILNANENSMKIVISDEIFELKLYENKTVEEFKSLLPLKLNMSDLHNNEKYATLPKTLPTNKEYPQTIKKEIIHLIQQEQTDNYHLPLITYYHLLTILTIR